MDTRDEEEGGMDGESNMETMCFYDRISKLTSREGIDLPKATEIITAESKIKIQVYKTLLLPSLTHSSTQGTGMFGYMACAINFG